MRTPEQVTLKRNDGVLISCWLDFVQELDRAEAKHVGWPTDLIHGAAIVGEEAGEVLQAAIDVMYAGKDVADLESELIQTGTMCLRMLHHLRHPQTQEVTR